MTARTYEPPLPIWCAGCGHFGVLSALQKALRDRTPAARDARPGRDRLLGHDPELPGHLRLPRAPRAGAAGATGAALANPDLTVIGAGGDGDGYAIGVGHLVHAFRRNSRSPTS